MPSRRPPFVIDAHRLTALFDGHAGKMTGFFARRVGSPEVAIDLTAETFAQAFASRARFSGSSEQEGIAWLYGIARHVLAHHLRDREIDRRALERLGVMAQPLVNEDIERILELAELDGLLSATADAVDRLPREQREAVLLRVRDELDYEQLAKRTGVSEETARSRVSRGLRRLATMLPAPRSRDA